MLELREALMEHHVTQQTLDRTSPDQVHHIQPVGSSTAAVALIIGRETLTRSLLELSQRSGHKSHAMSLPLST
eukprot:31791-Eustigmatos_ZCMA.PRE.1